MSHAHLKIYSTTPPFNTGKSKLSDLKPWREDWSVFDALETLFNQEKRLDNMTGANTVTRIEQIKKGRVSKNYDDEPYIVPFLTDKSDTAVLIIPGGAYYDVSLDNEGYPTAERLQKNGINAFVLKYRVWPYKYPTAHFDGLRAVRYLKANAEQFHINPECISVMGFSAGGNLAVMTALKSTPEFPKSYKTDETDYVDPSVFSLCAVYPEVLANRFLTAMQFGQKIFDNEEYFSEIAEKFYLPRYVENESPPAFITSCADDTTVPSENALSLALAYSRSGAPFEIHTYMTGGHGYGTYEQDEMPEMFGIPKRDMRGTNEWLKLYLIFLDKLKKEKQK